MNVHTWQSLWNEAWPFIPTSEASEQDVALYKAHAESLNLYNQTKEAN